MKRAVLFISSVGCGPPYHGNRARVKSLLSEIRSIGYEIDFAGVCMSSEEKDATIPRVDRWVADFEVSSASAPHSATTQYLGPTRRIIRRLGRLGRMGKLGILTMVNRLSRNRSLDLPTENLDVDRWFAPHWQKELQCLQARAQYKHVFVSYVFHSAFLDALPKECVKILDTHDVFGGRKERMQGACLDLSDYWFTITSKGEKKALMRADKILAIQEGEAKYFRKLLGGRRKVATVGHFVETMSLPFEGVEDSVIGFLASDNPLNMQGIRWFLEEVFPVVRLEFPKMRLRLGGRICDTQEWPEGVELLGLVDSVKEFHRKVMFTINPMQAGTGLKIKTVESLAYGRAVVATPWGADGLDDYVGLGLVKTLTASEFAKQIVAWLQNPEEAKRQGANACKAMKVFNRRSREALKAVLNHDGGD